MPATVKDSRSSIKTDPLRNFRFQVNINHTAAGQSRSMAARLGFMTLAGLSVETDLIAYRQGGMNTTTQKMPGQTNFPPLSLSRGMMVGTPDSYNWFKEIFSVVAGQGSNAGKEFRADIDIYVLAHPWTKGTAVPVKAKYHVYNAWPQSLAFSDLDAGGNALLMESMVLQHEGFGLVYAPDNGKSDVAGSTKY